MTTSSLARAVSTGMFVVGVLGGSPVYATSLDEAKAFVKSKGCPQCHGISGNTGSESEPPVPKLAGQPKAYLIKAMKDYRSKARSDEIMGLLMTPRTDAEIELIAEWFSNQKRY